VQDVIGKTGSFVKQFVVGGVTQFVEGWQVCWLGSIHVMMCIEALSVGAWS